jgi:hypothetical protein
MEQEPAKPRFSEVCQMHHLDYQAMQTIAGKAGVLKQVVDAMSVSVAVRRTHATAVLTALSDHTDHTWTLDNVRVALLPTFRDFHTIHQFDLAILSTASGVSFDVIGMMLRDEQVSLEEAKAVLRAASKQACQSYTISNIDVKVTK